MLDVYWAYTPVARYIPPNSNCAGQSFIRLGEGLGTIRRAWLDLWGSCIMTPVQLHVASIRPRTGYQ